MCQITLLEASNSQCVSKHFCTKIFPFSTGKDFLLLSKSVLYRMYPLEARRGNWLPWDWMVVSRNVGAENQMLTLYKRNSVLSHRATHYDPPAH